MSAPLVACVLLTADRPEMTRRAVQCFEAQTYERKRMLIWDTGRLTQWMPPDDGIHVFPEMAGASIGALRNAANRYALHHYTVNRDCPELFAHWDSDDWSHPNRLAEQVALIESEPQLDMVGYDDLLFWDSVVLPVTTNQSDGEAWLYSRQGLAIPGTTFLYRRAAWERKPFEDVRMGEDQRWQTGLRTKAVTSFPNGRDEYSKIDVVKPRMIASIHGGNTSSKVLPHSDNWRRVPEWDRYCRDTMALPVPVECE